MVQITAISDTHNQHVSLSLFSGDILVHCGDIGIKGNHSEAFNFLWWFVRQPFKYKVLVAGNHDKKLKASDELQKLAQDLGIIILNNSGVTLEGVRFWGGNFVPSIRHGMYRQDVHEREAAWKDVPVSDIDVLITHAPPAGILDKNVRGESCGCDILLDKVLMLQPKYHIFGHIHEDGGLSQKVGRTTFINIACMDQQYILVRHGHIINIP